MQRERLPSSIVALNLLKNASSSLTSLNLDWVLTMPTALGYSRDAVSQRRWIDTFLGLFDLRCPNLRAFQLRNAVVADTLLPQAVYLLDHSSASVRGMRTGEPDDVFNLEDQQLQRLDLAGLKFMEAHPRLQCLAWPMEHFFSEIPLRGEIARRVENVVINLGRTLTELRVDSIYSGAGELQSEDVTTFNIRKFFLRSS